MLNFNAYSLFFLLNMLVSLKCLVTLRKLKSTNKHIPRGSEKDAKLLARTCGLTKGSNFYYVF